MAWEKRFNQVYFYRSVRVGGKVKKIYFGVGPVAVAAAEAMKVARLARERVKESMRAQREQYRQADAVLVELADELDQLLAVEFLVAEK